MGESSSIEKLLSGGAFVFLGLLIDYAISFLGSLAISRYLGPSSFGGLTVGLTVLLLLRRGSLLGLNRGISRYIPRANSKRERSEIISTSVLPIVLSVLLAGATLLFAPQIAGVFDAPEVTSVLRVVAIATPGAVLLSLAVGVSRGHNRTNVRVLSQNLVLPLVRVGGIAVVVLIGGTAVLGATAYTLAYWAAGIVAVTLLFRQHSIDFAIDQERAVNMLSFSAPLAVSGSMWFIFSDIDTFLLGALATTTAVGVYKVAYTLGKLVFLAKTAFEFLAMPVFSEYHAKDDISNMRSIYIILAKWTLILALPITLTMMLLPRLAIRITFGTEYVAGGTALSILAIGFMIHVISGANTSCLSAMGYTKLVMWDVGGAAILNIGLNVLFIPQYTEVGAAVATVLSYVILNTVAGYQLYRKNQIQPFSWRVFAILLSGTGSYILLLRLMRPTDLVSLLVYLSLFGIVYIALVPVFAVSNKEIKLLSTHLDSTHWLIRLLNRVNF